MNILMLISELGYGGAETAFVNLARELARDHRVEIAVFKEQYQRGNYQQSDLPAGLIVHRLDPAGETKRARRWIGRIRKLRALKRDIKADATISFLTGPNALNVLAGGSGRAIVSVRGSRRYDFNSAPLWRWVNRVLLDPIVFGRADAVVSVSSGLTREVSNGQDGPNSKFRTISGYVDSAAILASATAPIEPELEFLGRQPVLVAAGRLSREKGFGHLLRIFARVRHEVDGAKLLLLGDGPDREPLLAYCAEQGLRTATGPAGAADADVIFLGFRSEPNRYFRFGRAFVFPSLSEGFPNILVEALGAAVPVIVADVPWGSSDVLGVERDADHRPYPRAVPLRTDFGWLMPRIDDEAFAGAWAKVMTSHLTGQDSAPADIEQFHRRVREFSCANAAARWNALLVELAGARE